jgi:prepilin-type N-terminal cleavage/methylation domain-containing protein
MPKLKEEGYTLVEILIAIAILAFGLLAVATMQVTAIKTNATASGISQGLTLGQAKVEELMNLPYSALSDGSSPSTGKYTVFWNVAVNVPVTDSKTIRVIVTWTEKGKNKRINLDFVKTNLS